MMREMFDPSTCQTAEVTGIVTKVNFNRKRGQPTTFRIRCPNAKKSFNAVCTMFCPIRTGDTIYALCKIGPDQILHVWKPPFVQPCMDRESIIQCFMRSLKIGYRPTVRLYNTISRLAEGDEMVIPYLSELAQQWTDTRNAEILFMFQGSEPERVKKLLNWWHRERNLRRLYLFGLTKKEINACRMTCDQIYQRCMDNPYTVPAIPIEKCNDILDRRNLQPNRDQQFRGAVIRVIWKNLHSSGWTGTPTRFLSKQFPGIKDHVEALKSDYDVVTDLQTAYLKFPHQVETWMARYLIDQRTSDVIQYDTPIDERIHVGNTIVERMSAHFTRTLSEDQQKAIQGALDHTVSIITGAAGCGKCLAAGTPVLMFDGSIQPVESIQVGDLIMGPDSEPRSVQSTCSGIDEMFEIIPEQGKSFVCNAPHVLTLIGKTPHITPGNVVHYTVNGRTRESQFPSLDAAFAFMKQLPPDIFDVPLNQYLEWPYQFQRTCRLFHVGIEFPELPLPEEPFALGEFLDSTGKDLINAHLPKIFKCNSRPNRLSLLNGLVKSNGWKGEIRYIRTNQQLTEGIVIPEESDNLRMRFRKSDLRLVQDVEYLIFSLGKMCIRMEDDEYYYLELSTDVRQKFKVESLGQGNYYGFELDGDGRFLLGDFLVTHNTTCLGEILHNLEMRGITYAVCSFTGKAVARIREVTKKRNPSTMHRLISNTRKNLLDRRSTQYEKEVPLTEYEVIVVDEASMVTTELLYDLLCAYPSTKQLVLVGDPNQLPPIGWGNLLYSVIKSETIPTYRLTTNYRVYTAEGERDGIILNSNAIITHDPMYPFEFIETANFSLIEGSVERVYDIINGCFRGGINADQMVILTPYNRHLDMLNRTFQQIYDVGKQFRVDTRGVKWMIGDRVMLTQNVQEIGVYNGESGTIIDLTDKAILVDFGVSGSHEFLLEPDHERMNFPQGTAGNYRFRGKFVDRALDGDEGDMDDGLTVKKLLHSYAMTIDKSQGSEWDFVVVYIPEFNTGSFLNKNRIYTAITRGKRVCWNVVSDIEAYQIAAVKPPPFRCENLHVRLSSELPNLKPFQLPPPNKDLEMANDLTDIPEDYFDMGFDPDF